MEEPIEEPVQEPILEPVAEEPILQEEEEDGSAC